jgi:hypothetical protein
MEHAVLARLQTERAQGGAMVRSRRALLGVAFCASLELRSRRSSSSNLPVTTPRRRWWRRRRSSRASDRGARRGAARAVRARSGTPHVLRLVGASAHIADVDHPDSRNGEPVRPSRGWPRSADRCSSRNPLRPSWSSDAVIALHVDSTAVGGAVVFATLCLRDRAASCMGVDRP